MYYSNDFVFEDGCLLEGAFQIRPENPIHLINPFVEHHTHITNDMGVQYEMSYYIGCLINKDVDKYINLYLSESSETTLSKLKKAFLYKGGIESIITESESHFRADNHLKSLSYALTAEWLIKSYDEQKSINVSPKLFWVIQRRKYITSMEELTLFWDKIDQSQIRSKIDNTKDLLSNINMTELYSENTLSKIFQEIFTI